MKQNTPSKKAGVALAVCGLAIVAGALANRGTESPVSERERADVEQVVQSASDSTASSQTASSSTSSLKKFFGIGQTSAVKSSATEKKSESKSKLASTLAEAWKQSTARLKYLDRCVESQSCAGFSQETPSSYGFATRLAQAQELRDFTQVVIAWRAENGGADLPAEAKLVARHFLKTGNDDVKDAALDLVKEALPSPEDLDLLIEALVRSGSGRLMEKAMQGPLLQYAGNPKVDRLLLFQLQRGSTKVQSEVAKNFLPYLTTGNHKNFERAAKSTFDNRSESAVASRANLKEFDRMSTGG